MKVSIQGIPGSFHHLIGKKYFKDVPDFLYQDHFREVFLDVFSEKAEFGIIAVENSMFGVIAPNYDLFWDFDVAIVGEVFLEIHQNLIIHPDSKLEDIKKIISHPIALDQCRKFLDKNPAWEIESFTDTAAAVKEIAESNYQDVGAIASSEAAKIYKMKEVASNIETYKNNCTRFFIISKNSNVSENTNKTSLAFYAAHKPGSLAQILTIFADQKINISQVQTRPIAGKTWEYLFYIDLEEGLNSLPIKKAFQILETKKLWKLKKVLGTYFKGKIFSA
jgi:prephenate dehydratase